MYLPQIYFRNYSMEVWILFIVSIFTAGQMPPFVPFILPGSGLMWTNGYILIKVLIFYDS